MALFQPPPHGERGRRCQPAAMSLYPARRRAEEDDAALCAPATAPQPRYPTVYEYACSSLQFLRDGVGGAAPLSWGRFPSDSGAATAVWWGHSRGYARRETLPY